MPIIMFYHTSFNRENVRINMRVMSILGVKLWNSLNESLVSKMSKYTFKRHYIFLLIFS